MFGSGSFAELAFCEQGGEGIGPGSQPSTNDGYRRGERKKHAELAAKLQKARELRDKAAQAEKYALEIMLTEQIAPHLLPPKETPLPLRKTLTLKAPQSFDADIASYVDEINRINRARWFRIAREYEARLEAARLAELDDEECILLLL